MTGFLANLLQFVCMIVDFFVNLLFPGFPGGILTVINAIQGVRTSPVIETFKTWVSYIAYFIPYDIWKGFFTASIVILVARIVFSLIKNILDLVKP